jgi:ubiquinone/menaquinone biosynthesis C-methylase UbiE
MSANAEVRSFWEQEPCGTKPGIVGDSAFHSREWFEEVERYRYEAEPFIHDVAQFKQHQGKTMLEVGVGAGTDHLQWARAGCRCHGVDLTAAAIETTREHLALYGFQSDLRRLDAETLPFDDEQFDLVYSWGVIHHSEHPEQIIREIHRVLKPGGVFIGMMYGRYSISALRMWTEHALLKGRPWRTIADVVAAHMESAGTKSYTADELQQLFASFSTFTTKPLLTQTDRSGWPSWISRFFPEDWGFFIALNGVK